MTTLLRDEAPAQRPAGRGRRPRMRWWVEAILAVVGYEVYGAVQGVTDGERAEAIRHGWSLIHLEQHLRLWVEPTVNSWLSPHRLLSLGADYYYQLTHALVTAAVLVWLWRRHPASYSRWRNLLLGLSLAALVVFWLYPVAPPRLTSPALADILLKYDALGAAHAPHGLIDLYAAMPSLHVAWAVWCALAVISVTRSRWRWVAFAYPAITAAVVLATANHYVLDIAAGAALAAAAAGVPAAGARFRRWYATNGPRPVGGLEVLDAAEQSEPCDMQSVLKPLARSLARPDRESRKCTNRVP